MKNQKLSFFTALLCFLFYTSIAQVAVTGTEESIVQSQTSLTLPFTVPAGDDRLLLVSTGSDIAALSLTFDGVAMNLESSEGDGSLWTHVMGTNASANIGNIVFTITGATPAAFLGINAISFSGVDQSTPVENVLNQTIAAAATSSSAMIASKVNDLVYDGVIIGCVVCFSAPVATPSGGSTTVQNEVNFTGTSGGFPIGGRAISGTTPGALSVPVGWNFSGSSIFSGSHLGLNVRSSIALPAEMSSFAVRQKKGEVVLEWETQSEINNRGFEIERSTDGNTYEKIIFLDSKGNGTRSNRYNFTDKYAPKGILYYRLKQLDFNGTFEYSKVVVIDWSQKRFTIYPNPAREEIHIETSSPGPTELSIYDGKGSLVKQIEWTENQSTIAIDDLPKGIFMLIFKYENQIFVEKLLKED